MRRLALLVFGACCALGCGAGQYGYSREYVALSEEEPYMDSAAETSYEEVRRDPAHYSSQTVGWFGVVTEVVPADDGHVRVAMTFRAHQDRHLCSDETAGSCRVTVADRPTGPFSAIIALRSEDTSGEDRVWAGSLLKVYGSPNGEFDAQGGPVLVSRYYRHWPRGYYRTTAARETMRR